MLQEMDLIASNDESLHQLWGRRQDAKHFVTLAIRLFDGGSEHLSPIRQSPSKL